MSKVSQQLSMRLSDFILDNLENILQEWDAFAASLAPPAQKMDKAILRDHSKKILENIAADLAMPQSVDAESAKSQGRNATSEPQNTAASSHGGERLAAGFSINATLAEYRALRANVARRWQAALIKNRPLPDTAIDDLIRFNEGIDQAINESVTSYTFEKEHETRVLDTILSSSPDLTFTLDLEGRFAYANQALIELLGLPRDQIVGGNWSNLDLPAVDELQRQIQQVITSKQQLRGEMPFSTPSGEWRFYDYILVPVLNQEGRVEAVACTARNITQRKTQEDKNWQKANYDQLTGLPNRNLFHDRLEQHIMHARRGDKPIALLFIDLDHFKETNDNFGHGAGDLLLQLVADRICSCVRETDTVARPGGDEFTVILPGLRDTGHVEQVAKEILKKLASSFEVLNHTVHISASIGITFLAQDACTPEELIKNADQAMYTAKNAGRNQFSFFAPHQA